jgi:hypothetical protein
VAREGAPGEGSLLAEVRCLFAAEAVETLRAEDERRKERRAGTAWSYLFPWPDCVPRLGPRAVGPFTPCGDCGAGSWAVYGGRPLCLPCAKRRAR